MVAPTRSGEEDESRPAAVGLPRPRGGGGGAPQDRPAAPPSAPQASPSNGSSRSLFSCKMPMSDASNENEHEHEHEHDALSSSTAGGGGSSSGCSSHSSSGGVPQSAVLSEAEASSQSSSNLEQMWEEDEHDGGGGHNHHPSLHGQQQQQQQQHNQHRQLNAGPPLPLSLDPDDAYADVRVRMESLSRRDRLEHAYHNDATAMSATEQQQQHQEEEDAAATTATAVAASLSPHQSRIDDIPQRKEQAIDLHTHIPFFAALTTYLGYTVLIFVGHVRDICANIFRSGRYYRSKADGSAGAGSTDVGPTGTYPSDDLRFYAPLLKSWENFYTRRLYHRIQDCFNRPIASRPGATIDVLERVSWDGNKTMEVLGTLDRLDTDEQRAEYVRGEHYVSVQPGNRVGRRCLNLGSYNYLGFADDWDETCREGVLSSLESLPVSTSSSRAEFGTTSLHDKVEKIVANFLGKEDAVVLNMGFNTNATTIPALVDRGDLLVSDELNHTSIVNGARASGAAIRTFKHNSADHLEEILRTAIVLGRPRTRRPWNKIMVIVEGIYSMEGEYCDLRNIVRVCKRYGAYLYLDEAHSIGAMGPTGRGCCEYTGVDPRDVDVLMGTFTKSFGGMGGYIAGSREVVDYLRGHCAGSSYHNSLSPVVCQQIISSFEVIMGEDGTDIGQKKLTALRDNSNYFRMRLTDMGLHVLGHYDSPIMPVMLYNPTKIAAFSRECLKRGLAVVVVGFPAVPILMSRARFCISAGHTREDLDRALKEIDEIANLLKLKYAHSTFG